MSTETGFRMDISAMFYVFENNGYIYFCGYICMKRLIFALVLMSGMIPYAHAAQLDATILLEEDIIEPSFQFLRVVYVEYPEGGEIAKELRGKTDAVSFIADHNTKGMEDMVMMINDHLKSVPSNSIVSSVKVHYDAILHGNENSAVIEFKMNITPIITNHVVDRSSERSTVDANWRGISISEPIILDTQYGLFDINNPKSALAIMMPNISEKLDGVKILEIPFVDSSGILSLPLDRWHSLFDNTAIIPGAVEYKYTGKSVITHYSMGECNLEIGVCGDREWNQEITLDKNYNIRIIESRDDATIALEGYVDSSNIDGVEVFKTSLKSLVTQKPDTDEFPAMVMYGMAAIAAIGGGMMFVISDRKIKKDSNEGQIGIDPTHLISYETSNSAGGYKTNRGESVLNVSEKSKTPV